MTVDEITEITRKYSFMVGYICSLETEEWTTIRVESAITWAGTIARIPVMAGEPEVALTSC